MRYLLTLSLFTALTASAASVQLTPEGCRQLAEFVRAAGESRDVGADLERYLEYGEHKNLQLSDDLRRLLRREVKKVFASKATPDDLYENTLRRCLTARGEVADEL